MTHPPSDDSGNPGPAPPGDQPPVDPWAPPSGPPPSPPTHRPDPGAPPPAWPGAGAPPVAWPPGPYGRYPYPPAPAKPAVAAAPPGTPYHRLARTPLHTWWRPVVASLLIILLFGLATFLLGIIGIAVGEVTGSQPDDPDALFADPLLELASLLGALALGIPLVMLAARLVQRRPAGSVISVTGRMRWRWLAACLGLATATIALLWALVIVLSAFVETDPADLDVTWVGMSEFIGPALVILVLVPLQSAGEEFMFRGWVIQFVGAYLRSPYPAILVGALLFSIGHGLGTGWGFADLVLFGVVAGWVTVRTGGLEAAIALHAMNNLSAFLLAAAAGELDLNTTAADSPWQLFATDLLVLPLYAVVAVQLARRMRIATRLPPDPLQTVTGDR